MTAPRTSKKPRIEPSIESYLIAPLARHMRAEGLDPRELFARFDLPPSAEQETKIVLPLRALRGVYDAASELLGDPLLGLHLAEALPRGTFGLIELLCAAAPDVGAALRELARRHALLNSLIVVTVQTLPDRVVVEHQIPGSPLCTGRHANELFVANLVFQGRRMTGRPFIPLRVLFAHPAPRDTAEIQRILGTRAIGFGAGKNVVEMRLDDVNAPARTADGPLTQVLSDYAETLLGALPPSKGLLDRVRAVVRSQLSSGPPTLEDVAERLQMSSRTLQRRLGDEGTALSAVVDHVREGLARDLLADSSQTIEAIGLQLGYADARAFLRAFKRWTGKTPSELRGTSSTAPK